MSRDKFEYIGKRGIRGTIETVLDKYLKEEELMTGLKLLRRFEPAIRNFEDALLGFILGQMLEKYWMMYHMILGREPTAEELSEYKDLLIRRSIELNLKIREFLMK